MAQRRLGFWRRFAAILVIPVLRVWTSRTWLSSENIPRSGGVIIAPNHVSHFDPLVVAHFIYGTGRWPRFLGKASLWKVPLLGGFLRKVQQIPVERGSVEAVKSLDMLIEAVQQGGVVVIYPEGTTTRQPELWPMRGKTGAARLALVTGAPVVPVANWGAEQIFDPRTSKLRFRRTPVTVIAGKPVDLSRWAGEAPSRAVLEQMTEAIMQDVSLLVGELRDETPPATLYDRPRRSATSTEETG
ncbi:MAG TPA: lysophospholipid acyltransferase family protein [Actinoplanes sp.]|nr:lysophospholipid acyltransferase family protein [Actinoplanes sp.]